MPKLELCKGY